MMDTPSGTSQPIPATRQRRVAVAAAPQRGPFQTGGLVASGGLHCEHEEWERSPLLQSNRDSK